MGKLVQVGRKLAVLGVQRGDPAARWHIVKPGTYKPPQTQSNDSFAHATSLCGRHVETNGFCADFRPADLCPACAERL